MPGSLVYTPPDHPVALDDMANWWRWAPGASWRHPEGPGTDIKGRDNEPVVQVSWDDAVAYAKWAGKRLPTEAEWEYASRGGLDGKRFPWGDEFRPGGKYMANTFQGHFPDVSTPEDGYARRSPVKSFPANGYGLYDMAGNVWQWTSDWYRVDYFADACASRRREGSEGPDEQPRPERSVRAQARGQGRVVPVQRVVLRELSSERAPRHAAGHGKRARGIPVREVGGGEVGESPKASGGGGAGCAAGCTVEEALLCHRPLDCHEAPAGPETPMQVGGEGERRDTCLRLRQVRLADHGRTRRGRSAPVLQSEVRREVGAPADDAGRITMASVGARAAHAIRISLF